MSFQTNLFLSTKKDAVAIAIAACSISHKLKNYIT